LNHLTVPIAIAVALSSAKLRGTLWLKRLSVHNQEPGAMEAVLLAGFVDLGGSPRHSHPARIRLRLAATYETCARVG
jgi:hypothetical protein